MAVNVSVVVGRIPQDGEVWTGRKPTEGLPDVQISQVQFVKVYQAITLAGALDLNRTTKLIPCRGWTRRRALETASALTGKPYKSGDAQQAAADLRAFAEETRAGLTVVEEQPR